MQTDRIGDLSPPGRRLFPEGQFEALRLVESVTTTAGVVIATYQPV